MRAGSLGEKRARVGVTLAAVNKRRKSERQRDGTEGRRDPNSAPICCTHAGGVLMGVKAEGVFTLMDGSEREKERDGGRDGDS